jgi:hypothetical protein
MGIRSTDIGAAVLVLALSGTIQNAAAFLVYDRTINNPIATITTLFDDELQNCLSTVGCIGKKGLVSDLADSNLGDVSLRTFEFTLTPAEIADINSMNGQGILKIRASRDIGLRQKTGGGFLDPDDWLDTVGDTATLGRLFEFTQSTCGPGENAMNLDCGPNFHNDFTANDSLVINMDTFRDMAADGKIDVVFTPTASVGRLKIFTVELQFEALPEPASIALFVAGFAGLAFVRRRRVQTARSTEITR